MKVLLDTCIWGGVYEKLQDAGYDVIWTGTWEQDPGDEEIIAYAHRENRVLVTLDKDFGELAVVFGLPHSGIIRLVNMSTKQQCEACLVILKQYEKQLTACALITAERDRIRIRE